MIAGSNVSNMAARSLIMDLLESPNGTLYGILIAFLIVILTTGLCFAFFIDSDNDLHPRSIYFHRFLFRFYDDVFVKDRKHCSKTVAFRDE